MDVVFLFASCGSFQCCNLHDLQFVNAGLGCKRQPYGKCILQSWSHDCLVGSHECLPWTQEKSYTINAREIFISK